MKYLHPCIFLVRYTERWIVQVPEHSTVCCWCAYV